MEDNKHQILIRTGNMWSTAWLLSLPAVIAMVLYGLNGLADLIFIGQYCTAEGVAGGSIAGNFSTFAMGFGSLVGVGMGTVLSISIGARDKETQSKLTGNLNGVSLILSALVGVLSYIFAEPFMRLMGAQGEVLSEGLIYLRICILGTPFVIHGVGVNMVVRAEGKMKSAAVMMGTGLAANVLCNFLFMSVLDMGIAGAAWGTNIGMAVYSIVGIIYLASGKATFKAHPFAIRLDKNISGKAIGNGMSSLIMTVMTLLQAVIIYRVLSHQGSAFDQAFYGVTFRILNFLLTPIFGLMRALQPVIGINYGAKDYQRVKKAFYTFLLIATILVIPIWLTLMIFPSQAIASMLPGQHLNPADLYNFRFGVMVLPLLPVMFMAMTFFPAIGKGGPVAVLGMARQVILYIPVMLILPRLFGISWIYKGSFLIDLFLVGIVAIMIRNEFKRLDTKSRTSQ